MPAAKAAKASNNAADDKPLASHPVDVFVQPKYPAPLAHLALLVVWLLPHFVEVPANANVLVHACLAVYVGCVRSVKVAPPTDSMTKSEAMRFPIVGSCVLFGLFIALKFLPKHLINLVMNLYFGVLGAAALTAVVLPFIEPSMPKRVREMGVHKVFKLPLVKEPFEFEATMPELLVGLPAGSFALWYCVNRHWLANNALGLAFSVEGIEHLALGSVQTGTILLCGLFFYDIFWVFCTPVMVSVAKSFDAPIKLLFPRGLEGGKQQFSMLGLGDIVIPGIFVALMLRYDVLANGRRTAYFRWVFGGYATGVAATLVVMNVFKAAQPALLYIVPALLATAFSYAAVRRELGKLWHWHEVADDEGQEREGAGEGDDKAGAEGDAQEAKKTK